MRTLFILLWLGSLALGAAGPVLILSFDGLSAQQFSARTMPRFWKLSEQGQRGEGVPPAPCTTFNGHATLATGCWPEHHGIVANAFIDPALGKVPYSATAAYLLREPLWVAATRSRVRTAVYHWPCATGPWEGVSPWRLQPFAKNTDDAQALAFSARALKDGAQLVMAYISGTDAEGHTRGPGSRAVRLKLAKLDQEIAPWVQRMLKTHAGLRVLLLADHGMAAMRQEVDVRPFLGQPATVIAHGGSAAVYLTAPLDPGVEPRLRALGLKVWSAPAIPQSFHLAGSPRIGQLLVEGPMGTWIAAATTPRMARVERGGRQGAHGYASDQPELHTWLVALGTGRRTPLPTIPLWDIAPTVARWLNLSWAQAPDGVPVPELP